MTTDDIEMNRRLAHLLGQSELLQNRLDEMVKEIRLIEDRLRAREPRSTYAELLECCNAALGRLEFDVAEGHYDCTCEVGDQCELHRLRDVVARAEKP